MKDLEKGDSLDYPSPGLSGGFNIIRRVFVRGRQEVQIQRRWCDAEAEAGVLPPETGKARKRFSPRASRRSRTQLTP